MCHVIRALCTGARRDFLLTITSVEYSLCVVWCLLLVDRDIIDSDWSPWHGHLELGR